MKIRHYLLATSIISVASCHSPAPATVRVDRARSVALFQEAAKVIQHPRCMNCHPADRSPTQGDDSRPHTPLMNAGAEGHGPPGLECKTCHGDESFATFGEPIASVPGNPQWGLAPASMAWQHKSLHDICVQMKDPGRNGGRSLSALHEHLAKDPLVGWAWHPGKGRNPAPGTQEELGKVIAAWIESGAHCP